MVACTLLRSALLKYFFISVAQGEQKAFPSAGALSQDGVEQLYWSRRTLLHLQTAAPPPSNAFMSPYAAAWWVSGMNSCCNAEFKMEIRTWPPNFQIPSFRELRRRLCCLTTLPLQAGNTKPAPTLLSSWTAGPTVSCHIPSLAPSWPLGFLF